MGRKSYSVDLLNDFVIDNLTPYSWAEHWWRTEADKIGRFRFCMLLEPNDYEHTVSYSDLREHISHPSSNTILNSYVLPEPEYFHTYGISLEMWNGSAITTNGLCLDKDKSKKFKYHTHLAKNVLIALEMLHGIVEPKISSVKEVFGDDIQEGQRDAWKKVISYSTDIDQVKREEWSFI
tara:strand:- start:601 stop:1137 length:537 start_codon:yes stop_codon:yes gene_type:complete